MECALSMGLLQRRKHLEREVSRAKNLKIDIFRSNQKVGEHGFMRQELVIFSDFSYLFQMPDLSTVSYF